MDLGGAYYNTKDQVSELKSLLAKLPDPTTPARPRDDRPKPGRAKQLDADQVQELIAGYQAGATVRELGARFGISRQTVSAILQREGVEKRRRTLTAEQVDELVRLYESGWSMARIGIHMNIDPTTVMNRLRERGVRTRDSQGQPR